MGEMDQWHVIRAPDVERLLVKAMEGQANAYITANASRFRPRGSYLALFAGGLSSSHPDRPLSPAPMQQSFLVTSALINSIRIL